MPLHDYAPRELEPRNLGDDEIGNPLLVMHELFSFGHLPEIRELLWTSFKTMIAGNYATSLTADERNELVYFYEQLEKLVEAAHLMHTRNISG